MAYQDFYQRVSQPFRKSSTIPKALSTVNKILVYATAAGFVGIAAWLAFHLDVRIVRYLLVCAIGFAACTVLRAKLNKPRPYELYDLDPLIIKNTKGKSFPSRHLFSATVIACAFFWLSPILGIIGFVAVAALALIRVVGGVHFPKDVIAGIALGMLCGIIGFWLI